MRDIGLPYSVSEADPPISGEEAQGAATAICRVHGGLIADHLSDGDHYGKVYLCPIGQSYWRLTAKVSGLHRPLQFPQGL